jgi:phenylpropionate dioxygenase-like ring-hydroxylating dioxygenase large terminal subunit
MASQLFLKPEEKLEIWEGVQAGSALPVHWYDDPSIFELEKEIIFRRTWHYVGSTEWVDKPGDFYSTTVMGVPVVITRDKDGQLHGLVNVCRHRACEVVWEERGNKPALQCRYHGWTYNLDGSLLAAPRAMQLPSFCKEDYPLFRVSVGNWGPWLFVCLSDDPQPLAEQLGELPQKVAEHGVLLENYRYRYSEKHDVAANWKVVVENYLECYHCPINHPGLSGALLVNSYVIENHDTFIVERAQHVDEQKRPVDDAIYSYNYLWPTLIMNAFGGQSAFARRLMPVSPTRTLVSYDLYFSPELSDEEARDVAEFGCQVFREDIPLIESCQRGLSSGQYQQQRLLLGEYNEEGPVHFQRMVCKALLA